MFMYFCTQVGLAEVKISTPSSCPHAPLILFAFLLSQVINCRLAMLGAFAGLTAELASGKSIIEQYRWVLRS
jgi:hypothetical protein